MCCKIFFKYLPLVIVLILPYQTEAQKVRWTHFRGSNLDGIADVEYAPVKWTADSNIVWKTRIHDLGWSSPVVYDQQVWMTTATEDGKEMFAVCVDYETGETIHDIKLFTPDSIYRKHNINSYATPTPCIEKDYVYAHFGRYGTACIFTDSGKIKWIRDDLECQHIQGPGSSPILYKNMLILHIEGIHIQYIIALDKSSGETIWKTERPKEVYDQLKPIGRKAYVTPIIVNIDGRDMLISNGSAACIAYDPVTGEEIWRIVGGEDSTIAMPFFEDGLVYFHTSFVTDGEGNRYAELLCVDPVGTDDIGKTNVLWRIQTPILQLSTPVIKDGLIYTIDTKSILMCIDAKSGEIIWSERLKGKFNASPIYAAGRVYVSSTRGEVIVIKAGKKLEIIAENKLEGEIWTTPVILNNNILIRTSEYLYKIGE